MKTTDKINFPLAHQIFSAECFNASWAFIDKESRSKEDAIQMLAACHASLWHWLQRADCTTLKRSIGYWQVSRVYSLLGISQLALHYAELCFSDTPKDMPFYLGYSYEALCRAAFVDGQYPQASEHLRFAETYLQQISDEEERQGLKKDLDALRTIIAEQGAASNA